jgi:hypothetical protein
MSREDVLREIEEAARNPVKPVVGWKEPGGKGAQITAMIRARTRARIPDKPRMIGCRCVKKALGE